MNQTVKSVLKTYPVAAKARLNDLRKLIFETALNIDGVGELEETLKWGEPAYLTSQSNSGTTIRIAWKQENPKSYSMYCSCQTSLIGDIKLLFPELNCIGNREIRFSIDEVLPETIAHCIAMALTYKKPQLLHLFI